MGWNNHILSAAHKRLNIYVRYYDVFKKTETTIEELKNVFVETEDLDFFFDYHIALWYPDSELGAKIIADSEFIKEESRDKMKDALKVFTDPAFSQLSRKEKVTLYQSRL